MKPDKSTWEYSPPIVILRYWVFQGMMYMNWIERLHRMIFEVFIFSAIFIFLPDFDFFFKVVTGLIISHTIILFVNGHFVALCVHDLFWFSLYRDKLRFFRYMEEVRARLQRKDLSYLKGAYFWGSLTRGEFRKTSDLDIRFIPKRGFWAGVKVAHLVAVERWHALWAGFPLDAYMFRSFEETAAKMDVENEPAVSLYDRDCGATFGKQTPISFESFSKTFKAEL